MSPVDTWRSMRTMEPEGNQQSTLEVSTFQVLFFSFTSSRSNFLQLWKHREVRHFIIHYEDGAAVTGGGRAMVRIPERKTLHSWKIPTVSLCLLLLWWCNFICVNLHVCLCMQVRATAAQVSVCVSVSACYPVGAVFVLPQRWQQPKIHSLCKLELFREWRRSSRGVGGWRGGRDGWMLVRRRRLEKSENSVQCGWTKSGRRRRWGKVERVQTHQKEDAHKGWF